MIQIIGLLIAAYVFTRMVEILAHPQRTAVTKVFAALTLLAAIGAALMLIAQGASMTPGLLR